MNKRVDFRTRLDTTVSALKRRPFRYEFLHGHKDCKPMEIEILASGSEKYFLFYGMNPSNENDYLVFSSFDSLCDFLKLNFV